MKTPKGKAAALRQPARIDYLDGLRAVAIFMVMGFHYYSRWTPPRAPENFYPYGDAWQSFPLFVQGFFGVQLFFMISGFVIFMTLHRSRDIAEFGLRRFARLWPTMALCVFITFVFDSGFPLFFPANVWNFIPSLTFIDPQIYQYLLHRPFEWMDGAYWSLYVEVRFYVLAALLFFALPRRWFHPALLVVSVLVPVLYIILEIVHLGLIGPWRTVTLAPYLPWFTMGAGFYFVDQGKRRLGHALVVLGYAAIALCGLVFTSVDDISFHPVGAWLAAALFAVVFYSCFYNGRLRSVLGYQPLAAVGRASYSLYLLHQFIGVTLIAALASAFHLSPEVSLALPVMAVVLLGGASLLVYRYWEKPLNAALVRRLSR
jgi:peptidoglycan/LPS O-acetylase OafA/YrhL